MGGKKNKVQGKYIYRWVCGLVLTSVATAMFFYVWHRFIVVNNQTGHLTGTGNLGMSMVIYAVLYTFLGRGLHAFKIGVERRTNVIASQALTAATTDVIEIFVSMAITGQFRFFSEFVWRYILLAIVQMVVLGVLTLVMIKIYHMKFPPLTILEIYGNHRNNLYEKINSLEYKYRVAKVLPCDTSESVLLEEIEKYDAVLINDIPSRKKNKVLKLCFDRDKRVYFVPKISDVIVKGSDELNLLDTPLFLCRNIGISFSRSVVKRFFDILLSLVAIVLLSPIMLITAIAIHAEDGGPVFFSQERCTLGGRRFMILKFRSMIVNAESDGQPHAAEKEDKRITKVGKVIRSTRIDELPQLINILRGDMSIVGPRPERVEHMELYTKQIPEFTFRSKVKGGLTGYAQVYGKYNTTALDKLKLDLIYIMNYSLLMDVQIIFETVKILFQKESTEGFDTQPGGCVESTDHMS